jgi:hypothetical protein
MLSGLRAAPLEAYETLIPPLPAWTSARLTELSDERAATVIGSGVRVIGDPDLLRYSGDDAAPALDSPPVSLPTAAAAGAMEKALAGMLRQLRARPGADSARPQAAPRPVTGVEALRSRDLLKEVARRQVRRVRGSASGRSR